MIVDKFEQVHPIVIRDPEQLGRDVQNIIIQLPPQRRSGPHWAVVVLFSMAALVLVAVVLAAFNAYRVQQVEKLVRLEQSSLPRPAPVHYPAGTSAKFPPSRTLRLMGTLNDGKLRYVAQNPSGGEYVMIPPKDCHVTDGGPVCHYQGRSVTRFTG
jgi:hypothetical protein